MNYYFCDVCHYCFEAESLPDSCPDCGKTDYQNRPAIRSAAEKEVQDLLRARDEMGINQLTAFCVSTGGAILFLSQTTSLSLRHLLFNLFRHVNQAKSVEYPINVGHTPDIPQRLGSVHYLSDFTDIVIRQPHGTPSKALAFL